MPHFKDGRGVNLFDRVRFQNGARYEKDKEPQPTFAEGRVIAVDPGASSCELTILVGSGKVLGSVNLPVSGDDFAKGLQPRQGVILDGYWTNANAKDCELVE